MVGAGEGLSLGFISSWLETLLWTQPLWVTVEVTSGLSWLQVDHYIIITETSFSLSTYSSINSSQQSFGTHNYRCKNNDEAKCKKKMDK